MSLLRRLLGWLFGPPRPMPPGPIPSPVAPAPPPAVVPPAEPVAPAPPEPIAAPAKPKVKGDALGLDAGAFLPIGRDELKAQAEARGRALLGNVWFGRRDQIPPADDPRTGLIDRALVTHGLLAPEDLVEIHAAGAEMERLKPTWAGIEHRAAGTAEAAVEADRAARAAEKARKKAEAAERKRLRAEAIARRHAEDIGFLGRGVSGRLHERTSDLAALEAADLPLLSTPAELAEALGLPVPRLRWLAFHAEVATRVHYVRFEVPKRSGGVRVLHAPHKTLALAQRWVFERIVRTLPVEPAAHGFVAGRSILTNARPHAGRAVVVNLDLKDFFPSITFPRVRHAFARLGYSPAVATVLALLCTECPRRAATFAGATYFVATGPRGLPQGACTSPGLSNAVARRLDRRLAGLAAKLDLTYTRYADDLTFSGGADLEGRIGYLLARVRHLAAAEGFAVNEAKTRVLGRNAAQAVTGLVVNDRPKVARPELRRLRAILHNARTTGLDAQNREGRPDFHAWLRGKIAFVAMSQPELGAALRAQLDAFEGQA